MPNNAIVVVLGNVSADHVMQLAQKYYGGIPPRTVPARRIPDVALPSRPQNLSTKDGRAQESIWRRSYLAPTYTAGASEHVYALQVLGSLLASGPDSRLHERLVRGKGLAKEVGVDYVPDSLSTSNFSIYVTLESGASFGEVAKQVDLELNELMAAMQSTR